jgi:hypothetical protein
MLIGGYDLTIPTHLSAHNALEVAANTILGFWKEGLVEVEIGKNATKSSILEPYEGKLPEESTHVFVYQNKEAYRSWEDEGWTETWANSMVYLSMYETGLNCVLENPEEPQLKSITEAIRKAIQHENS